MTNLRFLNTFPNLIGLCEFIFGEMAFKNPLQLWQAIYGENNEWWNQFCMDMSLRLSLKHGIDKYHKERIGMYSSRLNTSWVNWMVVVTNFILVETQAFDINRVINSRETWIKFRDIFNPDDGLFNKLYRKNINLIIYDNPLITEDPRQYDPRSFTPIRRSDVVIEKPEWEAKWEEARIDIEKQAKTQLTHYYNPIFKFKSTQPVKRLFHKEPNQKQQVLTHYFPSPSEIKRLAEEQNLSESQVRHYLTNQRSRNQ
jgi:hypothetical protein